MKLMGLAAAASSWWLPRTTPSCRRSDSARTNAFRHCLPEQKQKIWYEASGSETGCWKSLNVMCEGLKGRQQKMRHT